MTKVIDIHSYKARQAAERGFRSWRAHFRDCFDLQTRLSDLSNKTLAFLVQSGPETQGLIYDLIMGALGLGSGAKFFYIDGQAKMRVLDISLFLLDQIRFECMRRLGWIVGPPAAHHPIIELVISFDELKDVYEHQLPTVLEANPEYHAYQQTFHGDRGMFVRRQIPAAIAAFLEAVERENSKKE
jgi:hypothetical protein